MLNQVRLSADRHPSFSAAHEMLLSWMESKSQRSFPIVAKHRHENSVERASNAASKFLDSLWAIHGNLVRSLLPWVQEPHLLNVNHNTASS